MSLVWKLDKSQVGPDGSITLYQGDDWQLLGKLVNLVSNYEQPVDSSQYAVSGFFPSATGGQDILATSASGTCGALSISLPASLTPQVAQSNSQPGAYLVLQGLDGKLKTVKLLESNLTIAPRTFNC